jgi:uncharacterized protein
MNAHIDGRLEVAVSAPELAPYLDGSSDGAAPVPDPSPDEHPAGGSISLDPDAAAAVIWPNAVDAIAQSDDPYHAVALAHAVNEWTRERCLPGDERLWGSILVATHLPEHAAREIRLHATEARMRQVVVCGNALNRTLGHPAYEPIHRAAAEAGLPIAIQPSATRFARSSAGGGTIGLDLEERTLRGEQLMTHLVGLVSNGVFERFESLQVVLAGAGVAWLTGVLWRLDIDFKGVRREVPWLTELPSAYIAEHVRVLTYPLEQAPPEGLAKLVEYAGGPQLLLYGSGRPNTDAEGPDFLRAHFPAKWHEAVLVDNARATFAR